MNNSLLISSKITQFDSKNFNFESIDKKIIVPKNAVKLKNMGESFINRIQIKNQKSFKLPNKSPIKVKK